MKLLVAATIALSFVSSVCGQTPTNQPRPNPWSSGTQAPDPDSIKIMRGGLPTSRQGAAENFSGAVRVQPLFEAGAPGRARGSLVTFEAGARTAWHTPPLGQALIVTAAVGRLQRWGDPIEEIRAGDVAWIPAEQKHWHGAAPNSFLAHIAISEPFDGKSVEWMKKVDDAQYGIPVRAQGVSTSAPGPKDRTSQRAIGDFAQLTDDPLYADVWEPPDLSKRDRSLVTVAALIAMNRPEQLRSHLTQSRDNGVSQE